MTDKSHTDDAVALQPSRIITDTNNKLSTCHSTVAVQQQALPSVHIQHYMYSSAGCAGYKYCDTFWNTFLSADLQQNYAIITRSLFSTDLQQRMSEFIS